MRYSVVKKQAFFYHDDVFFLLDGVRQLAEMEDTSTEVIISSLHCPYYVHRCSLLLTTE